MGQPHPIWAYRLILPSRRGRSYEYGLAIFLDRLKRGEKGLFVRRARPVSFPHYQIGLEYIRGLLVPMAQENRNEGVSRLSIKKKVRQAL